MSTNTFIGRSNEINELNTLLEKKSASLVVIKGRRRIGKSRLIEAFGQNHTFFRFSGLAPTEGVTAQNQRDEFALQLSQQTTLPELKIDDWTKLWMLLVDQCHSGRVIILFDEITWMAHDDHTFLSKLKNVWDLHLKKNSELILILCGSVSAWIEKNILSSTGYFGRVSLNMTLHELSLPACNQLFDALGFKRSIMEKTIMLSLTGGIPWYIEQVNPKLSALKNMSNLCFKKNALLLDEYKHIFHDLFGKRSDVYQSIAELLSHHDLTYEEISIKLNYSKGTTLTEYLDELAVCGYITRYNSWTLQSGKLSPKLRRYRLTDNFLKFYFRCMKDKIELIRAGDFSTASPSNLPGWDTLLGLQFENLVLNNRNLLYQALSIKPEEILAAGPFFQTKTNRQKGCQVDFMIQNKYKTLYVCEIKFSRNLIGAAVIAEVQEKINRISIPKGFAVLPVLIYMGELKETIAEANYFSHCVNLQDYFEF